MVKSSPELTRFFANELDRKERERACFLEHASPQQVLLHIMRTTADEELRAKCATALLPYLHKTMV